MLAGQGLPTRLGKSRLAPAAPQQMQFVEHGLLAPLLPHPIIPQLQLAQRFQHLTLLAFLAVTRCLPGNLGLDLELAGL
jgi:hypothetical protein